MRDARHAQPFGYASDPEPTLRHPAFGWAAASALDLRVGIGVVRHVSVPPQQVAASHPRCGSREQGLLIDPDKKLAGVLAAIEHGDRIGRCLEALENMLAVDEPTTA